MKASRPNDPFRKRPTPAGHPAHGKENAAPVRKKLTTEKTSLLERTVIIGANSTSLGIALKNSKTAYAILPESIKTLVHRSLEKQLSKDSDPLKYTHSNEFDSLIAQAVDQALQFSTLTKNQKDVVHLIQQNQEKKYRDTFITEGIRAGALNPEACNNIMSKVRAEQEPAVRNILLTSFIESTETAISSYAYSIFKQQLTSQGLKIHPVTGDGNCFYYSLIAAGVEPPPSDATYPNPNDLQQEQMRLRMQLRDAAQMAIDHYYKIDTSVTPPKISSTENFTRAYAKLQETLPDTDPRRFLLKDFLSYENLSALANSDAIKKNQEWAQYSYAILVAITTKHPVHLYGPEFTDDAGKYVPMVFDIGIDGDRLTETPIRILFNGSNHFEAIERTV